MRISDWSSDVCSSDLHKRVNGILFHGLSLLQRLHEGFKGVAHRRRNAGRPAIATQRGDLDDETRKLLAGAPDLLHRVQPGADARGEARAHLDEIVEVRRPEEVA